MPIQEVSTVCFVGAGAMGSFNSLLAAAAGYEVRVFDTSDEALTSFPQRQQWTAKYAVSQGVLDAAAAQAALANVHIVRDASAAADGADLLSESVFEQLILKRHVLELFDRLCPPKTILTTNTSNLVVSQLEDAVGRPERFAALHSYLGSLLLDIVGGPKTTPETIDILVRYGKSLGATPLVHPQEYPGYVSNALLNAFNSTAMLLVIRGRGTPEDVDRAWMKFAEAVSGPFGLMDFIGLDIVLDVTLQASQDSPQSEMLQEIIAFVRPYVEQGHLGLKSQRGFYTYPDPAFLQPDFLTSAKIDWTLHAALLRKLVMVATKLVMGGYATAHNVDTAWQMITRSQRGPFGWLRLKWPEILLDQFSLHPDADESYLQKLRGFLRDFL